MKRRVLSIALTLSLLAGAAPSAAAADSGEEMESGGREFSKLSQEEIIRLLEDNPAVIPQDVFVTVPSCASPYSVGEVRWEALQAAADRLNALRTLAGLPEVRLDKTLCENAQYGAVLLGAIGHLDHTPDKPEDMEQDFYEQAYSATSSSNLYSGGALCETPDGFMDDSDPGNIDRVGHRRWQLNPSLGAVGFGYALAGENGAWPYTVEKVFDTSGPGCDYDFIGWPASGSFPVGDFFNSQVAWSISLNEKYTIPDSDDAITVRLTRENDGRTWTFSGSDYSPAGGDYFHISRNSSSSMIGEGNCIIFRPFFQEFEHDLAGETYTVTVEGLTASTSGNAVTDFTYSVRFFDPELDGKEDPWDEPEWPTETPEPDWGSSSDQKPDPELDWDSNSDWESNPEPDRDSSQAPGTSWEPKEESRLETNLRLLRDLYFDSLPPWAQEFFEAWSHAPTTELSKMSLEELRTALDQAFTEHLTQLIRTRLPFPRFTPYFGQFHDIQANAWFYGSTVSAYETGLMKGTAPDRFSPHSNVTLAETVALAARIHSRFFNGEDLPSASVGERWYDPYMDYAEENRLLPFEIDHDRPATREEFAAILAGALPREAMDSIAGFIFFADGNEISCKPEVLLLCRAGILNGIQENGQIYFQPNAPITRAQAAAVITRMVQPDSRLAPQK